MRKGLLNGLLDNMENKIYWDELFKIRIANSDESFQKHEIVKLLLVMKLIEKNRKDKNFIRIYTEFNLDNDLKCDVYFENARSKEVIIYEIQKNYTDEWIKDRTNKYKDYEVPFMKSTNWIPIPLKKLSNDIEEINRQLEEYIFI